MATDLQQINEILFWNKMKVTSGNQKTSLTAKFVGVLGEIFYIVSNGAPSIYYVDVKIADEWEELAKGTAKDGKLTIVDIDFFVPEARLRVVPSGADAFVTAKAGGYPAVFSRGPYDPCTGAGGAGHGC